MTAASPHLDAIRELAAEGLSNVEIGRRLGIGREVVRRTRHRLGIASSPTTAGSFTDAFHAHTRDAGDGHLDWTGPRTKGVGTFTHAGIVYCAGRAAFLLYTGRQPVGTVKAECGRRGCVGLACVEDAPGRVRARAATRVVYLRKAPPTGNCRNGHSRAQYGRFDADGDAYCAECQRVAAARRLASSQGAAA